MTLELTTDELLSTTRSVRKRLDLEREVGEDVLRDCLRLALQAPTGSLRQDWHFVVSNDRDQCQAVGEIYRDVWLGMVSNEYLASVAAREPDPVARADWERMMESARHLAVNFPEIPAVFVPCIDGRLDGADASTQALKWGSIIQGAWSFMLAARSRGLGTCWTTVHLTREQEVAEVLGIPYETVQQVALIPVAYTKGTDFKPGRRKDEDLFVHFNGW
jgi:nitroreductase